MIKYLNIMAYIVPERLKIENFDDNHCSQISLIIASNLLGLGDLTIEDAERLTGYREGIPTWPYANLAYLASQGIKVKHIEALDPNDLIKDPRRALTDLGGSDEVIEYILSITDIEKEAYHISRCLESGLVEFVARIPTTKDIDQGLTEGKLPIVSLDASVISDEEMEGYQQHAVVITGMNDQEYIVQDSGSPARWDFPVDKLRVGRALHSPEPTSGGISILG